MGTTKCEECGTDLNRHYEPGYTSTLCPSCACTGGIVCNATPEALALARRCAAEDFSNAYSESGESCESILSDTRESYRARIGGPEYDGAADDAAQEYACAYTDLVKADRPVCQSSCDHD